MKIIIYLKDNPQNIQWKPKKITKKKKTNCTSSQYNNSNKNQS